LVNPSDVEQRFRPRDPSELAIPYDHGDWRERSIVRGSNREKKAGTPQLQASSQEKPWPFSTGVKTR
jgi:hypothetical protein